MHHLVSGDTLISMISGSNRKEIPESKGNQYTIKAKLLAKFFSMMMMAILSTQDSPVHYQNTNSTICGINTQKDYNLAKFSCFLWKNFTAEPEFIRSAKSSNTSYFFENNDFLSVSRNNLIIAVMVL